MQFKIGDVVQLKSGGPYMTVIALGTDDEIFVVWFNQEGSSFETRRYNFPAEALTAVKEGGW